MIFIISTSKETIDKNGTYFWGTNYFITIKPFLPANITEVINITKAIIFFNKSTQKHFNSVKVKVTLSHITNNYLKIHYTSTDRLEYKSFQINDALKKYFSIKNLSEIPFCTTVDENRFFKILENNKIISSLSIFEEKNDWDSIYKILKQYFPPEKSAIWNDAELLSKFAFATAKLSECSGNLKKLLPDNEKRKQFIAEKRILRQLTIKLRKRCTEIEPGNAAYYSNLAYTYYQSVTELTTSNSRKDGNIDNDASLAIEYFNRSLVSDPLRITDLYRKGLLLSEILYNNLMYKNINNKNEDKDKSETAKRYLEEGISEFEKCINIYETALMDEYFIKRYKKYYIKTLYHLAQNYIRLSRNNFNLLNPLYAKDIFNEDQISLNQKYFLLDKAEMFIDKCIEQDYNRKKEDLFLIDKVEVNNFVAGVYKAYVKGLLHLYLFALSKKTKHLDTAKEYFQKALEINYPLELKNQNKLFILEKIAVLNILENKSDAAVKILESIIKRNSFVPLYVVYTLTIAYLYDNQTEKAFELILKHSESSDEIFKIKFKQLSLYNPKNKEKIEGNQKKGA